MYKAQLTTLPWEVPFLKSWQISLFSRSEFLIESEALHAETLAQADANLDRGLCIKQRSNCATGQIFGASQDLAAFYSNELFQRLLKSLGHAPIDVCRALDSNNWLHNKTIARARHVVSLTLLCFSPLQWLIRRDFKYETFRDLWIPLNSVSEVSIREQGQRRLPRTDSIHINCKRVCKIVKHFENASFSYVLALEKKNGSG